MALFKFGAIVKIHFGTQDSALGPGASPNGAFTNYQKRCIVCDNVVKVANEFAIIVQWSQKGQICVTSLMRVPNRLLGLNYYYE